MNTQLPPAPPSVGEGFSFQPSSANGGQRGRPGKSRWRRRLPVVFAAIVSLVASTGAGAFLGARHEDNHWTPLYNGAVREVAHSKSDSLKWQQSTERYHGQLQDLQTKITASVGDLTNPHFVLWNSCGAAGPAAGCPLTPGYEYVGGAPDTFTYYVSFRSTVPVTVRIMTTHDYVCWKTGYCAAHWVGWQDLTSLHNGVFHDAEGCAGYLAVFTSKQAGTLYPDVSITRNPAPEATGACG